MFLTTTGQLLYLLLIFSKPKVLSQNLDDKSSILILGQTAVALMKVEILLC